MSGAPRLGAVLLAAGAAQRFGGRPKALLELDGVPIVRRTADALLANGIGDVVVVLGHHADAVAAALLGLPLRTRRHPRPDEGAVSSQRLGLAALPAGLDAIVMALADQPLVGAPQLAALLQAWHGRRAGAAVLHPQIDGRRGNPVVLADRVRGEILARENGYGSRHWQADHAQAVVAWTASDPGFVTDIDSEADRADFERTTGRALRWPD